MNTNTTLSKGRRIQLNQRQAACAGILLLLLLLTLPAVVQAQFDYTINNGTVTITGYTGSGGAVTIPAMISGLPVASIGDSAFAFVDWSGSGSNCQYIVSVTIPDSVTSIGSSAFYHCSSLTNVTLGTNVTTVGEAAFSSCSNLTSVTIPASVTSIWQGSYWEGVFYQCSSLTAITVNPQNPQYSSVAGVLFNRSQTTLITCPEGKVGAYTIPDSVSSIEYAAFLGCRSLTSVTIPNSVTSIGIEAFVYCSGLTSVTIPGSVTNTGNDAFAFCTNLTDVTIGNGVPTIRWEEFWGCTRLTTVTIAGSVVSILADAFVGCDSLTSVYFQGNAPNADSYVFAGYTNATVYYLPGTTGWGTTFGGRPAVLWNPPTLVASPQTQTAEAGTAVGLRVKASGALPLFCLWYLNSTNLLSCSTNRELDLTNLQFSQSGAYTVVVTNTAGAITSPPAMLNVIAAVERRPVPGIKVTGEAASLLNVDYANSLSPAPNWTPLLSVSLTSTSQYYFDLAVPLPPQRYFRGWQTGMPGVMPSLDLHQVPAITLTGTIGHSVRLDYINRFGPIDAWVTLATVPLANTSQLYFDISAPGQPPRLYRLVQAP